MHVVAIVVVVAVVVLHNTIAGRAATCIYVLVFLFLLQVEAKLLDHFHLARVNTTMTMT